MPNNAFIAAVAAAAGTYLLHSTLLVALVWLMTRRLRARNFALQERLWQLALLGPLLTVAVQSLWPGAAPVAEWRWGTSATEPESTWRMAVTPTHASPVEIPDIAIAALSRSPQTINGTSTDALEHMRDNRPPMPALPRRYSATAPNRDALQVAVPDLSEPWVVTIVPGDVPADSTAATIVASVPEATPSAAEVQLVPGLASETPDAPIGETPNAPRAASTSFTGPLVWLGIAVLGGMLTGLVRLLVHTHTIRRWTRRCRVIDSGPARHLLDQWLMKTSYRRPVRLMTSDAASEPGAWGIVRPTILIPQALESTLTRDELRSLLAHELAHLLRRDPLWLWIGRSIREVCWWQPLNRVALHSWRQCAEHLCDDWTVEQGVSAVTLAKCLTSVAAWRLEGSISPALPAAATSLSTRVERLLADRRTSDRWCSPRAQRLLQIAGLLMLGGLIWKGPRVVGVRPVDRTVATDNRPTLSAVRTSALTAPSDRILATDAVTPLVEPLAPPADIAAELRVVTEDLSYALTLLVEGEDDPDVREVVAALQARLTQLEVRIERDHDHLTASGALQIEERSATTRMVPNAREVE